MALIRRKACHLIQSFVGLSRVVDTLGGLVAYLPSVLAAALILLFERRESINRSDRGNL
jgi:hypothetical protein